jgi:hypothetical protein
VASAPETLTLVENRDLRGRRERLLLGRRASMAVFAFVPLLALLNLFGQRPETSTAANAKASLHVYAPMRARSGNVYAARFTIHATPDGRKQLVVVKRTITIFP